MAALTLLVIPHLGTPSGSPDSEGMIFEVAYVPFGKPDTPFRTPERALRLQYVDHLAFNGTSANARDNNNFYLSAWTARRF